MLKNQLILSIQSLDMQQISEFHDLIDLPSAPQKQVTTKMTGTQ